jgi:hypothetical protein
MVTVMEEHGEATLLAFVVVLFHLIQNSYVMMMMLLALQILLLMKF